MIDSLSLRAQTATIRFLNGEVHIKDLRGEMAELTHEAFSGAPPSGSKVIGQISLLLAEHGSGHLSDDAFRTELLVLAKTLIAEYWDLNVTSTASPTSVTGGALVNPQSESRTVHIETVMAPA